MDDLGFLEKLYIDNYSDMLAYSSRFFRSADAAQDIVQDAFVVAQRKLPELMDSPSPRGWLYNVLKNVIGDTFRRNSRLLTIAALELPCGNAAGEPCGVRALYDGAVAASELELLLMVYCEGYTYREAADRLGISLSACKKRIQRAKQSFKKAIGGETEAVKDE